MTQQRAVHPSIGHTEAYELAETAYRRFADLVETIEPAAWVQPTDCVGWTVRDLVGHMVGAMRSAASMREFISQQGEIRRRVKRDGGSQTDVMTALQIELTAGLDELALAKECRALVSPAARGRRRTPALIRHLVRFPVEFGSTQERWNLGYLVDVILTRDAWMHRIDLCRALEVEPMLTAAHDGRIVADVAAEWARRHGRPVRLELTGPAGGEFTFGKSGQPIEMDAVEFCRTVSGRATGAGLLATDVPF